jgi:hypothetical protein
MDASAASQDLLPDIAAGHGGCNRVGIEPEPEPGRYTAVGVFPGVHPIGQSLEIHWAITAGR